jgi:hypothetical protein
MRRLAWVSALAVAVACGVDLPDTPGRSCDDDHPCRNGRTCVAGRCFDDTSLDDGGGGGAGGGGGGNGGGVGGGGGGGSSVDAGRVLWVQGVHGFTGQDALTGCMVNIETTFNNRVVSTIASSVQNRAVAINAAAATLDLNGNGRLRGKFQIPQPLTLKGNSSWLFVGPVSAPVIQFRFTSSGTLECFSAAGTLDPSAITQTITFGGGFQPNVDYLVDVTWKRGVFRDVAINGTTQLQATLTPPSTAFVKPTEMRLGINNYGGTADAGWTITLSDWALGEEPETPLP